MVSLTRYERFSAFLTGQPYQRQRRQVKNDLQMKHMIPAGLTKGRLGKLSPEKYGAYMEVLEIIGRKFPKLEISSRRLSQLSRINLEGVDKRKLAYRVAAGIEGGSLKLAEIPRVAATMQRESLLKTTLSTERPPDPVRIIEVVKGRQLEERAIMPADKEERGEESQRPFSLTQYFGGSTIYRSGRYTTEYNDNPAKNYGRIWGKVLRDLDGIVEDVLGEPLPKKEMEDHALYVNHSFTDRVGEEVTGFATSDEHSDYPGRLIYYAGIMVKKAHRGGRTAYLTFRMMLKIFKNLGLAKLLFGRTPLVYRTQDRRIHKLGIRYYSAKSDPREFTEEDWNAVRFTARKYGWELVEGTNICRQVYNKRLVDKPEQLLPGLGELDASVCVGNASCRSPLMLLWDVFVKKRVQFNGDKPSVRFVA